MRSIPVAEITAALFVPYGDLLETPATPPRQGHAAGIADLRRGAGANLASIAREPFAGPMPLRRLETHPHSSQAFLPSAVGAYLVVVATDWDGAPDEDTIRAFRVPGHAGINDRAGAWHAPRMTLSAPGTFAMLDHEDGSAADCRFAPIAPVVLDPSVPKRGA